MLQGAVPIVERNLERPLASYYVSYHNPHMARPSSTPIRKQLLGALRRDGWLRRADLDAEGIHPRWLQRLESEGVIERTGPGLYRRSEPPETTNETLFEACAAVPLGVVCLVSALVHHELVTANPSVIDMAIPHRHWHPRVTYPPIRFYEFRPHLMQLGLQRVPGARGRELRVFNTERSICDAFRLKRIVGKDIALEALQTYVRRRSGRHLNELITMARETQVYRQVRPYIEALT